MAMRLDGQVAIITGAASGIGKAIAVAFAAEGARVVIADLDQRQSELAAAEIAQATRGWAVTLYLLYPPRPMALQTFLEES